MQLKTNEFRSLFSDGLNGLAGELGRHQYHLNIFPFQELHDQSDGWTRLFLLYVYCFLHCRYTLKHRNVGKSSILECVMLYIQYRNGGYSR